MDFIHCGIANRPPLAYLTELAQPESPGYVALSLHAVPHGVGAAAAAAALDGEKLEMDMCRCRLAVGTSCGSIPAAIAYWEDQESGWWCRFRFNECYVARLSRFWHGCWVQAWWEGHAAAVGGWFAVPARVQVCWRLYKQLLLQFLLGMGGCQLLQRAGVPEQGMLLLCSKLQDVAPAAH